MKNIIYGGSFNPIHNSHIDMANRLSLLGDMVTLMPCYVHNFSKDLIDFTHRKHMCDLAVIESNNKKLYVSAYEKTKTHENCTYYTMQNLKRSTGHELWIAIGSDCAGDIHKWKYADELIVENNFIVFARKGYENADRSWIKPTDIYLEEPIQEMSSTYLRNLLKEESDEADKHIPKSVVEYIHRNKLYLD